ncbi:hypothetical protein [Streptomyces albidoflavus]|uniref:hypothetical protein n=1 Tax=Streptomyces albidoflavus TaxID=1886 RepID=UPI00343140AB
MGGESPAKGRGWQGAAAALIAIVLVAGVILILGGRDDPAPPADHAAPSTGGSSAPADEDTGACPRTKATDQTPSAAPVVTWGLVEGLALPVSEPAGPHRTDGDVAKCYAHSPEGALIAAVQISSRMVVAEDWATVMREQVLMDDVEGLIEQRETYEKDAPDVAPAPGELGQVAGYQWVTATEDLVVVDLVHRFEGDRLQVSTVTMRWQDGDWRYVGDGKSQPKSIKTLSGYVPWSGVA